MEWSMVFVCVNAFFFFNDCQWFGMVANHWSHDGMVAMVFSIALPTIALWGSCNGELKIRIFHFASHFIHVYICRGQNEHFNRKWKPVNIWSVSSLEKCSENFVNYFFQNPFLLSNICVKYFFCVFGKWRELCAKYWSFGVNNIDSISTEKLVKVDYFWPHFSTPP